MATDIRLKETLPEITEAVVATYTECNRTSNLGHKPLPSRDAVVETLCDLMDILYPGYFRRQNLHIGNVEYHVGDLIDGLHDKLTTQIARAMRHELEKWHPSLQQMRLGRFSVAAIDVSAHDSAAHVRVTVSFHADGNEPWITAGQKVEMYRCFEASCSWSRTLSASACRPAAA